ncbi:MAG TPA: hypothetical protein VMB22_01055 [Verrucomicrobiae bacterium]|nr:hypothetical protein [Verrucomicrobiae bacterium]
MKTTVGIFVLLATLSITSIVRAQPTNQPATTNTAPADAGQTLPVIQLQGCHNGRHRNQTEKMIARQKAVAGQRPPLPK